MILDDLAESTRIRIEKQKLLVVPEVLREQAEKIRADELLQAAGGGMSATQVAFPFEKALAKEGLSVIAEVKKASPSKGVIAEDFPYREIAEEYEAAGADAISCLTEPERFRGSDRYLREIAAERHIPILRKDFTIDPYMIYQAKVMGASAVLLIAAILSDEELKSYFEIADSLGLSCLFEAHDAEEVKRCLAAGARILGVNNRNLKDFSVDITNSIRLRDMVPSDILFVSESGIATPVDVHILKQNGTDAVLVGEMLMRSSDKSALIAEMKKV